MKKRFLTLLSLLVVSLSQAQNGGITNENASLKLEYAGMANGMTVVKVTNKDTCQTNARVQWAQYYRTKDIPALSSDTFHLQTQVNCFIMASSISTCRNRYDGQVEINYCQVLPIRFEYLIVRQVSERVVNVVFKVAEADGTDRFNIQVSKDGRNFKTVSIIIPDAIQVNKIYNVNVKL